MPPGNAFGSGPPPCDDHRLGIAPGKGVDDHIAEWNRDHPAIAKQDAMPEDGGRRSIGTIDLIIEPMDVVF